MLKYIDENWDEFSSRRSKEVIDQYINIQWLKLIKPYLLQLPDGPNYHTVDEMLRACINQTSKQTKTDIQNFLKNWKNEEIPSELTELLK